MAEAVRFGYVVPKSLGFLLAFVFLYLTHLFAMANEQLIDVNLLRPFVGDNQQMQQQLLQAFEKELRAFHESMQDITGNTNLETVRAIYHRISPSLKMLKQEPLIQLMEAYKLALGANEPDRTVLQTQQLMIEAVTNQLLDELNRFFQ